MNLHSIVAPYIGAVNPFIPVGIRISIGQGPPVEDGYRPPLYGAPGAFTGAIDGTILTVTEIEAGFLQAGMTLSGEAPLLAGTSITAQLSGQAGGIGTYSVNKGQALPEAALTSSLIVMAQLQPLTANDLLQLEGVNMNGSRSGLYISGDLNGIVRVAAKGGDLIDLPDGTVWLVVQQLEGWNMTAGWTKAAIVLQNGA